MAFAIAHLLKVVYLRVVPDEEEEGMCKSHFGSVMGLFLESLLWNQDLCVSTDGVYSCLLSLAPVPENYQLDNCILSLRVGLFLSFLKLVFIILKEALVLKQIRFSRQII